MRRTKIVCTIGPGTSSPEKIHALIDAGMNVARLNFSHGTLDQHSAVIAAIRAHPSGDRIAILQDLSGPKVRVGEIEGDSVELTPGDEITLTAKEVVGTKDQVTISIPEMTEAVPVGAQLLLDDGNIELKVKSKRPDALVCEVIVGGPLSTHKGVNAPGVSLPIASITDKDIENLKFGIEQKVDWVAASFVRTAADIAVVRGICQASRARMGIIAKIEKHEAVTNIDEIIACVDAVMVARGDLGVEIPIHEVPIVQKMIIKKCRAVGKPVITATQMLETMIQNPRPTRAEVSDIANAILDGTDAVMLSGETAVGKYPIPSVKMMDKVAVFTEESCRDILDPHIDLPTGSSITLAVGQGACDMARDLKAALIVTATSSGSTAQAVSRFRPKARILALTHAPEVQRRLALVWGVSTVHVGAIDNSDSMIQACVNEAAKSGSADTGSVIIMTGGVPVGSAGNTNFIRAHCMGQPLIPDKRPL